MLHGTLGSQQVESKNRFFLMGVNSALLGWFGIAMILGSALLIGPNMSYPGFWALLPSLGAWLVLLGCGLGAKHGAGSLLSLPIMQQMGRASYSWYLWHWPILLLGRLLFPASGLVLDMLLVLTSLGIAVVALYVIEWPLRHHAGWLRYPRRSFVCVIAVMLLAASCSVVWREATRRWIQAPELLAYQAVRSDLPAIYAMGCDDWFSSEQLRACAFGDDDAAKTAVLFGDSIVAQWFSAFAVPLTNAGWRFIVLTKSACPMVEEPIFYERIGMEYKVCEDWRSAGLAFLRDLKPDVVFTGSTSTYGYTESQWRNGSIRFLADLSQAGSTVFLLQGSYRLPFDGPDCLSRSQWMWDAFSDMTSCTAPAPLGNDLMVSAILKEVSEMFGNVYWLDFNHLVCPRSLCQAVIDGEIVFRDSQHLTDRFVRNLMPDILELLASTGFTWE